MVDNKFKYDNDADSSLYENDGLSTLNDFTRRVTYEDLNEDLYHILSGKCEG